MIKYPEVLLTPFSEWHHPKTGSNYIVLGVATCSTNGIGEDTDRSVVYWSKSRRNLRYREIGEFLDGRFVPVDEHGCEVEGQGDES